MKPYTFVLSVFSALAAYPQEIVGETGACAHYVYEYRYVAKKVPKDIQWKAIAGEIVLEDGERVCVRWLPDSSGHRIVALASGKEIATLDVTERGAHLKAMTGFRYLGNNTPLMNTSETYLVDVEAYEVEWRVSNMGSVVGGQGSNSVMVNWHEYAWRDSVPAQLAAIIKTCYWVKTLKIPIMLKRNQPNIDIQGPECPIMMKSPEFYWDETVCEDNPFSYGLTGDTMQVADVYWHLDDGSQSRQFSGKKVYARSGFPLSVAMYIEGIAIHHSGCIWKKSGLITVQENQYRNLLGGIEYTSEPFQPDSGVMLKVNTYNVARGERYLWNTGDTTSAIRVNKTGRYKVEVTDKNGCKYKLPPANPVMGIRQRTDITINRQ